MFGSFIEHMGRAVYTGIYEPSHVKADPWGFRSDVADLVGELGVTLVRYPGGNFVSGYNWEAGIGPLEERPKVLDLAWQSLETNEVGIDEFMRWARRLSVEPLIVANLATRGVDAARQLVEYCNHGSGSRLSDLRIHHGMREPYGIRLWGLGNEMDGLWQLGRRTAAEYGRVAAEAGKAMRRVDPEIELIVAGSSGHAMTTFGSWDETVLEQCYDEVDYLGLHTYYDPDACDVDSYLASAVDLDEMIAEATAVCDCVRAKQRKRKTLQLALDEWNVWHVGQFERTGLAGTRWEKAPRLIEDQFTALDAVVVGSLLLTLMNHADRVKIACQAQLVNVIAPIVTEPAGNAWKQPIFYPFADVAHHGRGDALRVEPSCDEIETAKFGPVPSLQIAATHDPATGSVSLFAVNRHQSSPVTLLAEVRTASGARLLEHRILSAAVSASAGTPQADEGGRPYTEPTTTLNGHRLEARLPPLSWNVILISAGRS
jgi:alpha-N-arabinofuranosidase